MENFSSLEIEFLTRLVDEYLEEELDLNQREWVFARAILDKLEEITDA